MKYAIGIFLMILAVLGGIFLKFAVDVTTNETTGLLAAVNATTDVYTIVQIMPWAAPALVFIIVIIVWARGSNKNPY